MRIFLDDERYPVDPGWCIVRSFDEFVKAILDQGAPEHVSFDHDLGHPIFDGMKCAKTLIDMEMNGIIRWPDNFTWYVHSQNPVGKENIDSLMSSYYNFRNNYFRG